MPRSSRSNPPRRLLSLYERNYRRLEEILGQPLPDLRSGVVYRLQAPGLMDLVVEVLSRDRATDAIVLSLVHYFEMNGDLCQDPEMVVRVFPPREGQPGLVEALSASSSRSRPSTSASTRSPGRWSPG